MDLSLNASEASSDSAEASITAFLVSILLISAAIWLVLSFTQQRTHSCKGFCWGLPGTVSAVNFLNPQHRIIYALAFGAFTSQFINLIILSLQSSSTSFDEKYTHTFVQSIYTMFGVLIVALLCYPVFACADAPIPLIGYGLGAFYCDLYAAFTIYQMVISFRGNRIAGAIALGSTVPQLMCLCGVLVWYHYKALTEAFRVCSLGKLALYEKFEQRLHENYVRNLLRGRKQPAGTRRALFSADKDFHYPFPFLIGIVVSTLMVFQLTILVIGLLSYEFSASADYYDENGYPDEAAFLRKFIAVGVITPIAAAVLVYGLFFHLAYLMRKRMKALWAGKTDSDINIHQINYPSFTLASAVRYTGIQIASVVFAWIFYTILFYLIGGFFVAFSQYPNQVGYLVYLLFVFSLWTAGILGVQVLIIKLFFISKDSHAAKTIVIDNRRAFNCFEYVVLLYNIAGGIMFNLLRLLLSALFTTIILLRMDRSLMVHGFELTDIGLRLYKNFITVETLLNNPVVHTFVNILKRDVPINIIGSTTVQGFGYQACNTFDVCVTGPRYSRRAYNRWMLAYTLIKNRSLISMRARNIGATGPSLPAVVDDKNPDDACFYVSINDTDMQKFDC